MMKWWVMQHTWKKWKTHTKFQSKSGREDTTWRDLGADGYKEIRERWDILNYTGLGSSSVVGFVNRIMQLGFHN